MGEVVLDTIPRRWGRTVAGQTFVVRERELARLRTFLNQALSGQGQVGFVSGGAGTGKTALINEFARRAQDDHAELVVAVGNSNAQAGIGDPYLPFREILSLLTGDVETKVEQEAVSEENAHRLRKLAVRTGQVVIEVAPEVAGLFLPGAKIAALAGKVVADKVGWSEKLEQLADRKEQTGTATQPTIAQSRIFEQYAGLLQTLAAEQPLVLVLDDLQWADASSIALLFHLGRRIDTSRILIVGSYRPEDVALGRQGKRHPLEGVLNEFKRYYGDIWVDLDKTGEAEGRRFVDALLDREPNDLDAAFRDALFQRTDGHPLFTVELLRAMQERSDLVKDGAGRWMEGPALDWDTLPARVEGVIEERVDRLDDEERKTVTIASVEGEEFTAEVVARVQRVDERDLVRRLSSGLERRHRLVRAEGVRRVGDRRLSRYRFWHKLFRDYLYDRLDVVERAYFHEDVGIVLEELYRGTPEYLVAIAPQLALHFQRAGVTEKAIDYLRQAGERAVRLSANQEAVAHFTQALALLKTMPQTQERAEQELVLQVALGTPLMSTKGLGAPDVEAVYSRAWEICQGECDKPELFPALWGLWSFYLARADWPRTRDLGNRFLALAEREQDEDLLMEAHRGLGATFMHLGQFGAALDHAEQGIALYDPRQHHEHAFLFGHDPGVVSLLYAAHVLWTLGYPDQGLARLQEALDLAGDLDHPVSIALAQGHAASHYYLRRESRPALRAAEAAIHVSTEHGFPLWLALGSILRGWALTEQGQVEEGIVTMRSAWASWRATGAKMERPAIATILADVYGEQGQVAEGLTLIEEALDLMEETNERWWEAEAHRVKGQLLLVQSESASEGDLSQVEACFRRAIGVAQRQQAKVWELRATVDLSRVLQRQGRLEEARRGLSDIYGWFSEGFETPDLVEAKHLLKELADESGSV